jgi:hypothetical protein
MCHTSKSIDSTGHSRSCKSRHNVNSRNEGSSSKELRSHFKGLRCGSGLYFLGWKVFAIGFTEIVPTAGNPFSRTLGLMTYPLFLMHFAVGSVALPISFWTGRYAAVAITIRMVLAICFGSLS